MPIYEYKCDACGHVFQRLQSIGAVTQEMSCPSCGKTETERLVSGFAAGGQKGASAGSSAGLPAACGGGFS